MEEVTLYQGDCLEIMKGMGEKSIDCIITSPPYFNAMEYSQYKDYGSYLEIMKEWILESYRLLVDGGRIAINIPDGYGRNPWLPVYSDFIRILLECSYILRGSIVWYKQNGAGKTSWGSWV